MMETTNEAPEVWRVECEDGSVVTATVARARRGGSVAVCDSVDVWSATRDDKVPYYAREASGDTPRQAVTALAGRGGLDVVAVLSPGQPTRAEVEAERDALRSLLAAAARGELPRCEHGVWLATVTTGDEDAVLSCDPCLDDDVEEWGADRSQWHDLPHAALLRAAMGGAK